MPDLVWCVVWVEVSYLGRNCLDSCEAFSDGFLCHISYRTHSIISECRFIMTSNNSYKLEWLILRKIEVWKLLVISENISRPMVYGCSIMVQRHRHIVEIWNCDVPTDGPTDRAGARDAYASKNATSHCSKSFELGQFCILAMCLLLRHFFALILSTIRCISLKLLIVHLQRWRFPLPTIEYVGCSVKC